MLFAAGFGTRMGALTQNRPKPLIPVAGRALIDHALDIATEHGPLRRVVNTHYLPDQMATHLADKDVVISHESPEILDTGGGLRAALPLLGGGPVFTLNTDAIWSGPNPLTLLSTAWNAERMDALLLCVPLPRALGRKGAGDFSLEQGRLHRGGDMVYTGAQILRTDGLADIAESAFSLNQLWNRMDAKERLFGITYPGTWCDIGHPEGLALAEGLLADV
ncbi:hypothetical protein P775_02200 [Puniceibacterium antarcticum]|uniref:MobA-like NTP transferase domain-containing protein n=2 Tax=Puniceibacterium antarcticum TaxID=1206336 RepID=A0A2G8RJM3_9RHOB|nr:hypothetical protein P775_02200 [Puniceibacterium antarcticum]